MGGLLYDLKSYKFDQVTLHGMVSTIIMTIITSRILAASHGYAWFIIVFILFMGFWRKINILT
jgi:hypothetical protein